MKLSTRKRLTAALGVGCGLLAVFAVVQKLQGIGRGYQVLEIDQVTLDPTLVAPLKQSAHAMHGEGVFLEIDGRSLFTQDRKPAPKQAAVVEQPKSVVPVVPLNAQLIGVVMTPAKKVAILRTAGGDQTFRLREGMPFPGELAGWRVMRIESRKVTFDGGSQGQSELKLDVARAGSSGPGPMPGMNTSMAPSFTPPPMSMPSNPGMPIPNASTPGMPQPSMEVARQPMASMPQPQPGQAASIPTPGVQPPPPPPNADQAAREAEVQRIIEERRAQMRAEAERLNSGKL
jgi:hypothetical protein